MRPYRTHGRRRRQWRYHEPLLFHRWATRPTLVRFGFDTPAALKRFLQERRILARLTHPAIARLLDGGTAIDDTGRETPYLVMEYVDGEPITRHCAERRRSVADRVALFRLVCDEPIVKLEPFAARRATASAERV